jgi:hypothetical protein
MGKLPLESFHVLAIMPHHLGRGPLVASGGWNYDGGVAAPTHLPDAAL